MRIRETMYRLALRALRLVAPLAAGLRGGESKLARGVEGRRSAVEGLVRWGREGRDPSRPVVWFHAPSVGESFQALAVARALLAVRPDIQIVYTYFSPSAEAFAERFPAAYRGFLPWDLPDSVGPVLDAVAPSVIAFTKTEVWPVLSEMAEARGIALFLIGASLPPGSGRISRGGRWLLGPAFRRLRRVAAIGPDGAERLSLLGIDPSRVVVTGDPGIDSAAERAEAIDPAARYLVALREQGFRFTVVAGSTWPADEEVLIPALTELRREHPALSLVVAPHEPTAGHVESLRARLGRESWEVASLTAIEEAGAAASGGHAPGFSRGTDVSRVSAVVVDRVGVLAQLYSLADAAFVGGGFHDEGLHSVLEPAALGLPVLFGPKHANSSAAVDLIAEGGGVEVTSSRDLVKIVGGWIADRSVREETGRRARAYVERHRGAARRSAEMLMEALAQTS